MDLSVTNPSKSGATTDVVMCPACNNDRLSHLEILIPSDVYREYALADRKAAELLTAYLEVNAYQVYRCGQCGIDLAHPRVAPSEAWYHVLYQNLKLYPTDRWEYNYVTSRISAGFTVADIGCGDGQFVQKALSLGINAKGFDFSTSAIEAGVAAGLPLHVLNIGEMADVPKASFTEIVCFHLLEHLSNPSDLFRAAFMMGSPNARLWVSVPSNLRPSRYFGEHDALDMPPHHLTRWTPEGLDWLGKSSNWRLATLIYEPASFKEKVWHCTVRLRAYRFLKYLLPHNIWLERILRSVLLPAALIKAFVLRNKITGFSMLAQFEKCT